MREDEACALLGVTARTLYRYRVGGRLPYRTIPGPTRPVIDYLEADLLQLRKGLEDRKRPLASPPGQDRPARSGTRSRVTFTLPASEGADLTEEAARYGWSAGEYARRLVRERLERSQLADTAELRDALARLTAELHRTRSDVAKAFEAVLEYVGTPPEDAQAWVTENLR